MNPIVWIVIGSGMIGMIACPLIADCKGRNAIGWFFGGLILGIIGIVTVICLKKKQ